ncbi:MAG: histidine phosphatase family protein [Dehalococcoidia bacterium]|nr:histidine phosphatase family protein [Dehalococcoidia bacterium]
MRLLLLRHAESLGNREFRLQGRRDFPLTERGRQQARALAGRLASAGLTTVYTSPIGRARETARILAGAAGVRPRREPRVQEYDFGEALSGLTWQEIREQHPEIVAALLNDDSEFPRYPGEEGRAAFRDRVCPAIREIAERHAADQAVAIVTHAGPIVVFVIELLGRKYSRPIPFSVDNASVTTVEFSAGGSPFLPEAVLIGLNDTCHLRALETGGAK